MNVTSGLTDAQRYIKIKEQMALANRKWASNNKQKVNELARNNYNKNKDNPEFRKRQVEKTQRAYAKRKAKVLEAKTQVVLEI